MGSLRVKNEYVDFFIKQEHIQHIVQTASIQTCPTPFTTLDDCNRDDFVAYQLLRDDFVA